MAGSVDYSSSSALSDALVILGAAGIVIPVFARFRITPVIGFILVGLAVGPFGLGRLVFEHPWLANFTISDPAGLKPFAEFGIVLLLFEIGLELSFRRLWTLRRKVFGAGSIELLVAGLLIAFALTIAGQAPPGALALGLALAMSSTALVLPMTGTESAIGRAALATLLFEDMALVPIIFMLDTLAPHGASEGWGALARTLGVGALTIVALLAIGRLLLPRLFAQAARTKSPELFLAASLLVVIAASLATGAAGLSPLMGALLAGLLIAETEYQGEVEAFTNPFKGLALGVFLITVGMSIDLRVVAENAAPILFATLGVMVVKAVVTAVALHLLGSPRSIAAEAGLLLASPSETTLIVLSAAAGVGLIQPGTAQFWQIVTALGLTVTPLLAWLGKRLGKRVNRTEDGPLPAVDPGGNRAIVIGAGRVGRLVAQMLKAHGKPYVAIDSDAHSVRHAHRAGVTAVFGDALRTGVLDRFEPGKATAVILTMDEPIAAQRLVRRLRASYPDLPIIARARDVSHAATLYRAGATHAVPETLESSLQLSEAVLVDLGVPMGPVIASIHEKRDEFRARLMEEGELDELPQLRSASLRERAEEV